MFDHKKYTETLQWHNGIEHFDYDLSIDWAIELMRNGIETESVIKEQAQIWIDKYIHGNEDKAEQKIDLSKKEPDSKSIWKSVKTFWK